MVKIAAVILVALGLHGSAPAKHAHRLARPLPAVFVTGHGWGHGIGMAQYGAYGYALHGWTYDRIVTHYYPGTTLGDADLHKVRVLLAERSRRVVVSSRVPFAVKDGNGKRHRLAAGVQALGPGLKLKLGAAKRLTALPGPLIFSPGSQPLSLGARGYRGALRVKKAGSGLQVVDMVGIEQYLWGVVPSEMPDRWPGEALAAQAVVARTYALAHVRKGGDFDVYPDTRDQVYGGIAAESPSTTAAANETAGKVVLYDDELAQTYFFSSSGGKTANLQDVWPKAKPAPYLVSVPDPYDTLSPYHDWGPIRFKATVLAKRLHVPGGVKDFRANVSPSGRVRTVTFVGTRGERTVAGSVIRTALGLRSTWFRLGLLSLTNPGGTVVYGSSATLAGVARGAPRVSLEARPFGGRWGPAGRLTVRNGTVSPVVRPRITTDYRLVSGGFRSGALRVPVAPLVALVAGTDGVSVSGSTRPVLPGGVVQIQRLGSGGWATVAQATIDSDGSFYAQLDLTSGSYRARVVAGRGFAAGVSRTVVVP